MTGADPGTIFSLSYDVQLADLEQLYRTSPARRRRRANLAVAIASATFLVAVFTAIIVRLDFRPAVPGSSRAPFWMYPVAGAVWAVVAYRIWVLWRTSPGQTARRVWRKVPSFHGVHADHVDASGFTNIAPDGTRQFHPWTTIDGVRETERYFQLIRQEGTVGILPKRGLSSPDLVPALRDFLNRSAGARSPRPQ